jgi:hypothetical protein
MDEIKGVTKNDLLKLKYSKPVPIIAHSSEIVIPAVYSTRVKEFIKKEGMKIPLSPEQLAGLKKKARETDGQPDQSLAVGGTVRAKERKRLVKGIIPSEPLKRKRKRAAKVVAPGKRLKDVDLKKPSNVKQVVNVNVTRLMRTPSSRAKPASNLPIRPGASIAPTTTEPYYQRLTTPAPPPNTTVPVTTSSVGTQSSLVKEIGEPLKQGDLGLVKDAAVQTNVLRKRPLVAPQISPYSIIKQSNVAKEAAEKSKTFKMMGEAPPPGMKRDDRGFPTRKVGRPPSILKQ